MTSPALPAIPTLSASTPGHSFVWYGDCCVFRPEHHNTANFAAVNAVFQRLERMPELVIFAGDNIMGGNVDADEHRRQWRHWLDEAMAWFWPLGIPIHQTTSNHNTFNTTAEAVFREIFPEIPQNGPAGQEGLSYWVRRDDLLLVFVNTNFSGLGGPGHVEHAWLDAVLTDQADAGYKLVIGHHPIFPVNGHAIAGHWCVTPEEGAPFWAALVRHGVLAYVCSHILAFDLQAHDGVLQVLTGGAGTYGMPTVGLMPESAEYLHLVQGALDDAGLRLQALDTAGRAREWLRWPLPEPTGEWARLTGEQPPAPPVGDGWIARFRISGTAGSEGGEQTLLAGWQSWEGPEALWIGLVDQRLTVQLVPEPGRGAQRWQGSVLQRAEPLQIEIAIHPAMGPGGVLCRIGYGPWSSLRSTSARGAGAMAWPEAWSVGHGQNGDWDRPSGVDELAVAYIVESATHAALFALNPTTPDEPDSTS